MADSSITLINGSPNHQINRSSGQQRPTAAGFIKRTKRLHEGSARRKRLRARRFAQERWRDWSKARSRSSRFVRTRRPAVACGSPAAAPPIPQRGFPLSDGLIPHRPPGRASHGLPRRTSARLARKVASSPRTAPLLSPHAHPNCVL